ncbi:CIC11C00000003134 [Sungouiella intermedia]|uniref:CIC11C00000003134 n=1 Tax=Sungouiella intermedia TaxID=45354 RepID=A0A1L0DLM1_9ASCO|nr:CIC11C00000003134 [[Candida] intermedia]
MFPFRPIRPRQSILFRGLRLQHLHTSRPALLFNKKAAPVQPVEQSNPPPLQNAAIPDDVAYNKHPILSKVPKFLRPYTTQFIHAPVSHVTAFIILHEITAIVPLIGTWYVLHQYHDLFMTASMDLPAWAIEKGTKIIDKAMADWDFGTYSFNEKVRFIMEGAYAYVIVKALFPVRLAFSLIGMPWFAKWFVLPFTKMFSRKRPAPKVETTPAIKEHSPKKIEKPRL